MFRYPILLLLLVPFCVSAQITIDANDMPSANNNYATRGSVISDGSYLNTGANYTWDYSMLPSNIVDSVKFMSLTNMSFVYQGVFSFPPDPANLVQQTLEIPIDIGIPIGNAYRFLSKNTDAYKMVGYGIEISGMPIPVKYGDSDIIFEFPLNYQDSAYDESNLEFSFPGIFFYSSEIERTTVVDGWGTLYLPTDTFDVLRVKSVITNSDSIYIDSTASGYAAPPVTTTEYTWLAKNEGIPVLQVTTGMGPANATFIHGEEINNIDDSNRLNEQIPLTVYPNPGQQFKISFTADEAGDVTLRLSDLSGKSIEEKVIPIPAPGKQEIDFVPNLIPANGIYMLTLVSGTKTGTSTLYYRK